MARRLNSRLFFTRFNFTITFRPGPKNTKPDAFSGQFAPEEGDFTPDTFARAWCRYLGDQEAGT